MDPRLELALEILETHKEDNLRLWREYFSDIRCEYFSYKSMMHASGIPIERNALHRLGILEKDE